MEMALAEVADGWTFDVRGWTVTRCFVDFAAFGLLVNGGTGSTCRFYIEGCFVFRDLNGCEQTFGENADATQFAPLLGLMSCAIETVFVSRRGDLAIRFENGCGICVPPYSRGEAWNLAGPGRLLMICPPGGGEPSGIWT